MLCSGGLFDNPSLSFSTRGVSSGNSIDGRSFIISSRGSSEILSNFEEEVALYLAAYACDLILTLFFYSRSSFWRFD